MPKGRNDEIDPIAALIAIVVLGLAFFWVFAVPAIEAWWAVWGLWVEVGLIIVAAGGVYFLYWWHKTSTQIDKELREKAEREQAERNRYESDQRAKGLEKFTFSDGVVAWGTQAEIVQWKKKDFEQSLPSRVVRAIEDFEPSRKYRQEFPYQTELQGWLKSKFPASRIELQTGSSRPDIVIEDIAIEVKGPTDNRALDTLTTKCLKYSGHYQTIILVLFEPEFSERNFEEIRGGIERAFPHVFVIRKDGRNPPRESWS